MKDCAGTNIEIGMECATNYGGYMDLIVCTVIGMTKQKVRLWTIIDGEEDEFHKFPSQIAIINKEIKHVV